MTAALLYRRRQRWQIWAAFGCAAAIHIVAIAIAESRPHTTAFTAFDGLGVEIDAIDTEPEQQSQQVEAPLNPEEPLIANDDETFKEDNPAPPPIHSRKIKAVAPVLRGATGGTPSSATFNSLRVLALSAPRPEYPYEARRRQTMGSGTAVLTINPTGGNVIDVRMSQSTGSPILDNATVSTLRRWRFRPSDVTTIQVPITFTLTGAVY
jgi:TonB family protein